jgi:membrane-associated protease RseP (regulator of RpoE activity)
MAKIYPEDSAMTLRVTLSLTLVLLFSLVALAQQPAAPPAPAAVPPAPAAPPAPPVAALASPPSAPAAPAQAPDAPETFSFSFNSSDSFLGIYPEEVSAANMKQYGLAEPRGVAVGRVIKESPAERAGLRKDDVIVRFNGEEVTGVRKLNRLIGEVAPEHTARLTILRGGAEQEISVTLAKREGFAREFGMTIPKGELDRLGNDLGRLQGVPGREDFAMVFGNTRRLGIGAQPLTKQLGDYFGVPGGRGVLITSVNEGGPAAKAGLKAGDVITAVDGQAVERVADLTRELGRKSEGEVTIQVIRDKSQRTFKLTPERGQSFDFGQEFNITPQVGQLVLPKIVLPALPQINLSIPAISLPAMPRIDKMTIPRIPAIKLPRLPNIPL